MSKKFSEILLVIVFLIGLSLLLYPVASDYWNSFHQSRIIADYNQTVADISEADYEKLLNDARAYNAKLADKSDRFYLSNEEEALYNSLLNISGNGVMGYIDIPSINVSLPIYHGDSDEVLQVAVGHIKGSSLPVGGESTHCVLSGHRGLPSAKLFTNLDELAQGDIFTLQVLNESLTYEVDRILIVEPDDIGALEIESGSDYCTLVTCTPYGVNSHRLLVRGHRVENQSDSEYVRVAADAVQIEPIIVASVMAAAILTVLTIIVIVKSKKKRG